ncbi:MAG TPA: enolase C-terminal domain-like protein [Stellaceae bacterium]|nr:enolase C-terminal domain-like protein [Stellaceae bacterium]
MSARSVARVMLRRIKLPLRQLYVSAMYIIGATQRTLIEIETADGRVGIGETLGTEEVFRLAAGLARNLIGRDALDRRGFRESFAGTVFENRNGRNGWSAFAGLELALWDWAGRAFERPLAALLGGVLRGEIEVVCPLPAIVLDRPVERGRLPLLFADRGRIADIIAWAKAQRAQYGFFCFKYKSAAISGEWDVAVMAALREAFGPDIRLRWDPNAAYPPAEAMAICGRLEGLGLEFYEDPTDGPAGLARLRAGIATPVATNMCVIAIDQLPSAIRHRVVDTVLADLYMWGGIDNYLALAAAAEASGLDLAVHSLFETGIGTAANLHLAAALPQIRRPNDCGLNWLGDDAVVEPMTIRGGRLPVPAGAGLGVTLDRAAIRAMTVEEREVA